MPKYEMTAPGFAGDTDGTDDHVLWLESDLPLVELEARLRAEGLQDPKVPVQVLPAEAPGDFRYPEDAVALKAHVDTLRPAPVETSRYFAMLDTEACVEIEGATTYEEAFNKELAGTHWVFTEEGLRKFVAAAQQALQTKE